MGSIEMTSAAKYTVEYPCRGSVLDTPYMPDAMVGKLGRYINTSIYSFHAAMPETMHSVPIAETACGSMMLKNTRACPGAVDKRGFGIAPRNVFEEAVQHQKVQPRTA